MTSQLSFEPLEPHLEELTQRLFPGRRLFRYEGFVVTEGYRELAEDILNMEVREDDIWVCTYPKSGTTWTQEMVWCIANDLNFQGAKVPQMVRFPFLEFAQMFRGKNCGNFSNKERVEFDHHILTHSVDFIKGMKSPRFIKTHLPVKLLPLQLQRGILKPKIFHVHRNPMDTCISYFHHNQLLFGMKGSLEDFATLFINDGVLFTPFWKHFLEYQELEKDFNILFLKYEDMKKDLPSEIRRTAAFLNKTLTEKQVQELSDHLNFENMKNNPNANNEDMVRVTKSFRSVQSEGRFMRNGTVCQWKSKFCPEWVKRFEEWTEVNLKGTDLDKSLKATNCVRNNGSDSYDIL